MDTLELVHLQLTWQCNLRCPFCGQWGTHGFAARETMSELTTQEWLDALAQIEALRSTAGKPDFILWGGEPLLSPAFPAVARELRRNGNRVSMVSNGALLTEHFYIINQCVDTLYLSVDGPAEVHDRIRNQPGLYETVRSGLQKIDRNRVKTIGLFTLCEENRSIAADYPFAAAELGLHQLIVQNLIYCTGKQAADYRDWLHGISGCDATHVNSWVTDSFGGWIVELPEVSRKIAEHIRSRRYPLEVVQYPAEFSGADIVKWYQTPTDETITKNDASDGGCCELPWKHLHIRPGGNVDFCVDHNDFTIGNLRNAPLAELLRNPATERFRQGVREGRNPLCRRCPWHYNRHLKID